MSPSWGGLTARRAACASCGCARPSHWGRFSRAISTPRCGAARRFTCRLTRTRIFGRAGTRRSLRRCAQRQPTQSRSSPTTRRAGSPSRLGRGRALAAALGFASTRRLRCAIAHLRTRGGGSHMTVRLQEIGRSFSRGVDKAVPHTSAFVAAGFYITHGRVVADVPFDPFLPYLFMGEEIALTIRLWTAGYDVYGPSHDVVKHEYVRKEHPKYWESISQIYSSPPLHNALAELLITRVQHLVGFPEARLPSQVEPASLLVRMDEFNVGVARGRDDFNKFMEMDLDKKHQKTPEWCVRGTPPPWEVVPGGVPAGAAGGSQGHPEPSRRSLDVDWDVVH